ncbi:MAG: Wzz/FepE/Etk N-terminal domain-containing protein [Nitrospirota bacterium]|nr:Wzz/FepE/Etk N-terminal domain-containing protein [Nitrospirota bacterium]
MDNNKEEIIEDEINLIDYLIVLAKRRKFMLIFTLSVTLLTAVYSFVLPPVYRAETTILPPRENRSDIQAQLLSKVGGLTGLEGNAFGDKSIYVDMIRSRTVFDRIIERFGLMKAYDTTYRDDARKMLDADVTVKSEKNSSLISISVLNNDPKLAAEMANALVEELQNLVQDLAITEASQRRLFFEEKLKQTKEALIRSEEAMRTFQERTGALKVEDQARAVIESIANLGAQIAAKEVELKVMKTYSTSSNPDLQKVEETLKGLKAELKKLEESDGNKPNPFMPTGRMAVVGTDYVRKLRDLKFNETLFDIMAKQYEIARIDEARDAAVVQVIDRAVAPEKKFKPARRQMVMLAFFAGAFFSVFLAFFWEYLERVSSGGDRERLEALKRHLSWKEK